MKSNPKTPFLTLQILMVLSLLLNVLLGAYMILYGVHTMLLAVALPATGCITIAAFFCFLHIRKGQKKYLEQLSRQLGKNKEEALQQFPMPIVICRKDGQIIWYNQYFQTQVIDSKPFIGENFEQISSENLDDFCNRSGVQITYHKRSYHIHAVFSASSGTYLMYFEDNTSLIRIAKEYENSRPVILMIMIDNYDEIFDDLKESEKSAILSEIDETIEKYIGNTSGFLKRLSQDKFIAVIEKRHLNKMIEDQFQLLKEVRDIGEKERTMATLSIGIGSGADTMYANEAAARQALDMALGRGGDQAAVCTQSGFQFYGGISGGVEKQTRVRTRVIATALQEFIEQSDRVMIMGHQFGDFDCAGASIGLASAVRKLGRPVYIVANIRKNLAGALFSRLKESPLNDVIVHPMDAKNMITERTLLIIVDTHNPDFVESKEVYESCQHIIVIDHHRKMVNYIDNALIFYHESYASSASEMVTELVQYLADVKIGGLEAEALMAGIMLDTKNFVIKTGKRTFEAAAYLRSLGADTVKVRRMFSSSIDSYQKRSRLVATAETYRYCAIAIGDFVSDDLRLIASQAADELLSISGVYASFIIFPTEDTANISARSLGDINVQLIMEELGGGGHQTMAACQLKDMDTEKARQILLEGIDKYFNDNADIAAKLQKAVQEKE